MRRCAVVLFSALLFLSGCSFVSYEDSSGRKLVICKIGQDTEIARLEAHTGQESLVIDNYNAQQAETLRSLLETLKAIVERLPKSLL